MKEKYKRIILDYSQAYFQRTILGIDTIYSCRKYFGVSDGVVLYTDCRINRKFKKDISYNRILPILGRFEKNAEIFYEQYKLGRELINIIKELEYDILISSGCPYILPVTELTKLKRDSKYINIHTSLLPDCKGRHPINAALLFGRKHGVTCHYMDDGIDTGDIIEQIEIPITDDVSLELLYKICFITEADVFEKALNNNFRVKKHINECVNTIYYTRNKQDYYIKTEDDVDMLFQSVRAFPTKGQYAKINIAG